MEGEEGRERSGGRGGEGEEERELGGEGEEGGVTDTFLFQYDEPREHISPHTVLLCASVSLCASTANTHPLLLHSDKACHRLPLNFS